MRILPWLFGVSTALIFYSVRAQTIADHFTKWPLFNKTCSVVPEGESLHPFVQEICWMVNIGRLRLDNANTNFAYQALSTQLGRLEPKLRKEEFNVIFKALQVDIRRKNSEAYGLKYACRMIQQRLDQRHERAHQDMDEALEDLY